VSLDGHIAGPKGEADWIIMDSEMSEATVAPIRAQASKDICVLSGHRIYTTGIVALQYDVKRPPPGKRRPASHA
jgi:hypothetical protein